MDGLKPMDAATDPLRALLALSPVRAALADARPAWLMSLSKGTVEFMNRAGARLLGTGRKALFSSVPAGKLGLQILNRQTASPLQAIRFQSHLAPGALPVQTVPGPVLNGEETLFIIAIKPLAKADADAYSLDDLLELLHETDLVFGLYDTEGEPIDQKGPAGLLNAAFDAAFPDPLDTISADARTAPVIARNAGQRLDGDIYPLSGFDRMLFLIAGTVTDEVAVAESVVPIEPDLITAPSSRTIDTAPGPATDMGEMPVTAGAESARFRVRFIFQTDQLGCLRYISGAARSLFAAIEGSPIGAALEELCAPEDLAAQSRIATALSAQSAFENVDVAVPIADHPDAMIRLSAIPITNPQDGFCGFRGNGLITTPALARTETNTPEVTAAPQTVQVVADNVEVDQQSEHTDPDELETGDTDFSWLEDLEDDNIDAALPAEADEAPPVSSNIVSLPSARRPREAGRLAPDEEAALDKIAQSIESAFDNDHRNPLQSRIAGTEPDPEETNQIKPEELDAIESGASDDDDNSPFEDPDAEWPPLIEDEEGRSDTAFEAEPVAVVSMPSASASASGTSNMSNVVQHPNAVTMAEQAALLERLPLGLAIFREDAISYANKAFFELVGYPDLHSLQDAGGLDGVFSTYALPGPGDLEIEAGRKTLTATRRDGTHIDVAVRLQSIPYGGTTSMLLSVRAAPEANFGRRETDKIPDPDANATRIDELNTIINTATDGIVVINADGTIDRLNTGAESVFGYTNAEKVGTPFVSLFMPDSQPNAETYLNDLAQNGVASILNDGREMIGRFKSGGAISLFLTVGRISGGDGSKYCAVLRDITHFKSAETELVSARKKAEDASAHKSEFLAKVSHEIRTPLNGIIGFAEVMMQERFGAIGNERYREYVTDIHTSGSHLLSLINDLLDLSKVEAGKLDMAFTKVDLNDLIQQCVAIMQPDANRERLIIRTNLPASVPNIVADKRSFRQIMLNVLSNSVKFTPAGGQIIVSTRLNERGEVSVSVRDTGIGLSEADLETALQPFRQIATAKARNAGTGLGLPLTKALVEANRAQFLIESAPQEGTTVRVTFPVNRVLAE